MGTDKHSGQRSVWYSIGPYIRNCGVPEPRGGRGPKRKKEREGEGEKEEEEEEGEREGERGLIAIIIGVAIFVQGGSGLESGG